MSGREENFPSKSAFLEAERLLRRGVNSDSRHGYLDVLGEKPRPDIRRDQAVFRSRLLPPIYERFWRPMVARLFFGKNLSEAEERALVLEMLKVSPGEKALDVGCGTGNHARALAAANQGGLVVGLDASRPMLSSATRRGGGENLVYMCGDACDLPFDDEEFDVVYSVGVIHMIGEPMKAVGEMVRVLAPGGRLLIVASHQEDAIPIMKGQVTTFRHNELTDELSRRGLTGIEQRVVHKGQFVVARKGS